MRGLKLRDYEVDWIRRIKSSKERRVLIVGPTGCGKTVVASQLMLDHMRDHRESLFVVHRRELVKQAVQRLIDAGVPLHEVDVILGGERAPGEESLLERRPGALIRVASIQSVTAKKLVPRATMVIVDEAHHATAKSYRSLLSMYPSAKLYGLTATPYRLGGSPLSDAFDEIVQSAPPSELIRDGWIVKPRVFTVPPEMRGDLSGVRLMGADYNLSQLSDAVNTKRLVGSIVEHWKLHAGGRPAVCYAVNVDHARHIASEFNAQGIDAEVLSGDTSVSDRVAMLVRLESGGVKVIVNCMVLTEGWDCPPAKLAIIARPTMSTGLWMQMAGRITRPGAHTPVVLDHAGNALVHGLPLEDVEFSLNAPTKRRKRHGVAPEKECPDCENCLPVGHRVCCFCGHEFWSEALPEEHAGRLVLAAKGAIYCKYEHCKTPHLPVQHKMARVRSFEMHAACRREWKESARVCQYEKCSHPIDPLSPKSHLRGYTMHKDCRAKSSAERTERLPERVRVQCVDCGSVGDVGRYHKAAKTPEGYRCLSCAMRTAWSRPEYAAKMAERSNRRRTRRCAHCGDLLNPGGEAKYHRQCWESVRPRAHARPLQ